jgi:hypothetical protein
MIALSPSVFPPALERLADEIAILCEPAGELTPSERGHLAKAVAFFLEERPAWAVERTTLFRATARAIRSIGYPYAATRVLATGLGLLRPLSSALAPALPAWGLDLFPLALDPRDRCELIFFRAFDALLRAIAPLWDETSGTGALGFRRLDPAVSALFGDSMSPRQRQAWRLEILAYGRQRLEMLARQRTWATVPHLFLLDGLHS